MTPEILWARYASIWTIADASERRVELAACLDDGATYCDPNGLIEGYEELSEYMAGFQQSIPSGSKFQIHALFHHNDRTLTKWALHGPDGSILQHGQSFGALSPDGRLHAITGFFSTTDAEAT